MSIRCTIDRVEDYLPGQFQANPLSRISNASVAGKNAIRFERRPGDMFNNTPRCEAIIPGKPGQPYEVREGSERWISFLQYLPSGRNWCRNGTIWQIRPMPETTYSYFGLGFEAQDTLHLTSGGSVVPPFDRWFNVLIRTKSSVKAGEVDIYFDGKLVLSSRGHATMGVEGSYVKSGIYGIPQTGTEVTRWLAISHLVVATTRAEAEGAVTPAPSEYDRGWNEAMESIARQAAALKR